MFLPKIRAFALHTSCESTSQPLSKLIPNSHRLHFLQVEKRRGGGGASSNSITSSGSSSSKPLASPPASPPAQEPGRTAKNSGSSWRDWLWWNKPSKPKTSQPTLNPKPKRPSAPQSEPKPAKPKPGSGEIYIPGFNPNPGKIPGSRPHRPPLTSPASGSGDSPVFHHRSGKLLSCTTACRQAVLVSVFGVILLIVVLVIIKWCIVRMKNHRRDDHMPSADGLEMELHMPRNVSFMMSQSSISAFQYPDEEQGVGLGNDHKTSPSLPFEPSMRSSPAIRKAGQTCTWEAESRNHEQSQQSSCDHKIQSINPLEGSIALSTQDPKVRIPRCQSDPMPTPLLPELLGDQTFVREQARRHASFSEISGTQYDDYPNINVAFQDIADACGGNDPFQHSGKASQCSSNRKGSDISSGESKNLTRNQIDERALIHFSSRRSLASSGSIDIVDRQSTHCHSML